MTRRTTKVPIRTTKNIPGPTMNHLWITLRLAAKTKRGMVIAYCVGDCLGTRLASDLRCEYGKSTGKTDEGEVNPGGGIVGVIWVPTWDVQ